MCAYEATELFRQKEAPEHKNMWIFKRRKEASVIVPLQPLSKPVRTHFCSIKLQHFKMIFVTKKSRHSLKICYFNSIQSPLCPSSASLSNF